MEDKASCSKMNGIPDETQDKDGSQHSSDSYGNEHLLALASGSTAKHEAESSNKTQGQNTNQKKLFVANLHQSTSEGDLIKLFQFCGNVVSIDYVWHKSGPLKGMPKGFAFIEMGSDADAHRAINKLNGQLIRGKKLLVAFKDGGHDQQPRGSTSGSHRILTGVMKQGSNQHINDAGWHYKRQSLINPNIAGAKKTAIVASCIDDNIKKLKASLSSNL